jgi:long-subunit fatty acid transport protein
MALKLLTLYGVLFLWIVSAHAEGFYLAPPGVEALGSAGSVVAQERQSAAGMFFNMASIARSKRHVTLQLVLPQQKVSFSQMHNGAHLLRRGANLSIPIPLLGGTFSVGEGEHSPVIGWVVGTPIPNAVTWKIPDALDDPLRYALQAFGLNALLQSGVGVAVPLSDRLSMGAGLQVLAGNLNLGSIVSACDGFFCLQPEDPTYDVHVRVHVPALWSAALGWGILYRPISRLQLGLGLESGYRVVSKVHLQLDLPKVGPYSESVVSPSDPRASLVFSLPGAVRMGARWFQERGSIELAVFYRNWSVARSVKLTPEQVVVKNLAEITDVWVRPLALDSGFHDTWSGSLGGEWLPSERGLWRSLRLRWGVRFEPTAIAADVLAPGTVDMNQWMGSLGASWMYRRYQWDVLYSFAFFMPRTILYSNSRVPNAVYPSSPNLTPVIGNGSYSGTAQMFGLGMTTFF